MATATEHAAKILKIAQPFTVAINLVNAELVDGYDAIINLGVLPGARDAGPVVQSVTWRIKKVDASKPVYAEILVTSEKAGTKRMKLDLNNQGNDLAMVTTTRCSYNLIKREFRKKT